MPHDFCIDARKIEDFGIGTYVRNLVAQLAEIDRENRYVLLSRTAAKDFPLDLPENFRVLQERSPVYSIRELAALSWRLFRLRVDLYHATHYVLPAAVPCPVVATIHDVIHLLYPEFLPNRLAFFYAQRMIRRTLSRGDRIIAVSKNTKADLARYFQVDSGKVQVVYNGVDDQFRRRLPAEDVDRWLRQLEIERPYLLFVGNPTKPHKNLDNVIQAFARARQRRPFDARLVCVGHRGPATFKLEQRAEQLGIGAEVRMLGHVANEALPALYQGATLFLYPTLYEGFGLPVVEAMASGLPVITSENSALKEIAEGHAHLVDPLDVDSIAGAIVQCMSDPEHRASLARLGLRRAEAFQWRRTAERTLEIYRAAMDSYAARGRLWSGRPEEPGHPGERPPG
ncbi:MAG TPA: glycosyltransferase family 1 protein [Thermoanaerobaculia bacterium]|nr:glycosyltransferase family 1 protein [Thermoanaerobaculia bacterium]